MYRAPRSRRSPRPVAERHRAFGPRFLADVRGNGATKSTGPLLRRTPALVVGKVSPGPIGHEPHLVVVLYRVVDVLVGVDQSGWWSSVNENVIQ